MKILHVIQGVSTQLGGLPAAMYGIISVEKNLGYESDVVTLLSDDIDSLPPNHYLFDKSFPRRFYNSHLAASWLRENITNYAVVFIHGIWYSLAFNAAIIAKNKSIKYVIWPHGSLDPFDLKKKYALKKIIGSILIKDILSHALSLCFTSIREAELVETYGAIVRKQVLSLPVNIVRHNSEFKEESLEFTFVFLGRIAHKKNVDLILQAFIQLCSEYNYIRLLVVGDYNNDYGKRLRKAVMEGPHSGSITFVGQKMGDDKLAILQNADCFVLPSKNENFGVAVIEALQCGVPVIISNNVYIYKEIEQNNVGWICETTIKSLYKIMKDILINRVDYIEKKEATVSFSDRYRLEKLSMDYAPFYEKIYID